MRGELTAKGDPGPFDIELLVQQAGTFAVDKSVTNDTGSAWRQFVMQLGTGVGAAFVPSTAGDGVGFDEAQNNREETGAFPDLSIEEDRIVFSGFLPAGGTAHFVVFVRRDVRPIGTITIRQVAVNVFSPVPALEPFSLALLAVLLAGFAAFRLRRSAPAA